MVDDALSHLTHGFAKIHGRLLYPPEGFSFAKTQPFLKESLGLVDDFSGGEPFLEVRDLRFNGDDLSKPGSGDFDRRDEV